MATIVIVQGGWVGGWFYGPLRRALQAAGHEVTTPTLTGFGERSHLLSPEVNLTTHVVDVVNHLHYEDLQDVMLIGHSYGGMVATGVLNQVPERIQKMIYLDAFVPEHGRCTFDYVPLEMAAGIRQLAEVHGGWKVPLPFPPEMLGLSDPSIREWALARMAMQPVAAAQQPVEANNPAAATIPKAFVYCSVQPLGLFEQFREKAELLGWPCVAIPAHHGAPLTQAGLVADALRSLLH